MELLKEFYTDEEGLGTVEMVVLLAVLVSVALIFRKQVIDFVDNRLQKILGTDNNTSITQDSTKQ